MATDHRLKSVKCFMHGCKNSRADPDIETGVQFFRFPRDTVR